MPSIADVVGDGLNPADHGAGDFCYWDKASTSGTNGLI
jgi:hypothetical protein